MIVHDYELCARRTGKPYKPLVFGRPVAPPGEWFAWIKFLPQPDDPSPYDHEQVEAWRDTDARIFTFQPKMLNPWFNVAGLWWRPLLRKEAV